MDHPERRAEWGPRYADYADYAEGHYSVRASVEAFIVMERQAIADQPSLPSNT